MNSVSLHPKPVLWLADASICWENLSEFVGLLIFPNFNYELYSRLLRKLWCIPYANKHVNFKYFPNFSSSLVSFYLCRYLLHSNFSISSRLPGYLSFSQYSPHLPSFPEGNSKILSVPWCPYLSLAVLLGIWHQRKKTKNNLCPFQFQLDTLLFWLLLDFLIFHRSFLLATISIDHWPLAPLLLWKFIHLFPFSFIFLCFMVSSYSLPFFLFWLSRSAKKYFRSASPSPAAQMRRWLLLASVAVSVR